MPRYDVNLYPHYREFYPDVLAPSPEEAIRIAMNGYAGRTTEVTPGGMPTEASVQECGTICEAALPHEMIRCNAVIEVEAKHFDLTWTAEDEYPLIVPMIGCGMGD
jgi:hypothetical protein